MMSNKIEQLRDLNEGLVALRLMMINFEKSVCERNTATSKSLAIRYCIHYLIFRFKKMYLLCCVITCCTKSF